MMNVVLNDRAQLSKLINSEYKIYIAKNANEIIALKDQWLVLERQAKDAIFFQSFQWCRIIVEHAQLNGNYKFFVCCIFSDDQLVGLLPLRFLHKKLRAVLTGLAEPFQQYTEMLVAPGHKPPALFKPIVEAVLKSGADYLHLGQVRKNGSLHKAIEGIIQPSGEEEGAPYVSLHQWPDFDAYYMTIKTKTRKNMRNARNRLSKDGILEHQKSFGGDILKDVIDSTYRGRAEWLSSMGLTSRAFRDSGFREFLNRFKVPSTSGIRTMAMRLMYQGKPIAEQWGFVYKKSYYAFLSTWDHTYEESSPGKLHLGEVLKSCYEEEIGIVDFMIPAAPYKLTWAPQYIPVQDYVIAITPVGKLYTTFWTNTLQPLAKRLAYKTPKRFRKRIVDLIFSN